MKIEFGVAIKYHFSGAGPEHLHKERFPDYDSANRYASGYCDECVPTIYLIADGKYVFCCERSAVSNEPYKVYNIQSYPWGQVETRVWWREFIANPKAYLHLAEAVL